MARDTTKDQDIKRRDFITIALTGGLGLGLFVFSGVKVVFAAPKDKPKKAGRMKDLNTPKGGGTPVSKCETRKPLPPQKCEKRRSN